MPDDELILMIIDIIDVTAITPYAFIAIIIDYALLFIDDIYASLARHFDDTHLIFTHYIEILFRYIFIYLYIIESYYYWIYLD